MISKIYCLVIKQVEENVVENAKIRSYSMYTHI